MFRCLLEIKIMVDKLINFLNNKRKNRLYSIRELYVGELGHCTLSESYIPNMKCYEKKAEFFPQKTVIFIPATQKEKKKQIMEQYNAGFMGEISWTDVPNFIYDNRGIPFYKLITLHNTIVPHAQNKDLLSTHTCSGTYKLIQNVAPFTSIFKEAYKTKDMLTLEEILKFEDYLNEHNMSR